MRLILLLLVMVLAAPAWGQSAAPPGCATPASDFSVDQGALDALLAGLTHADVTVRLRCAFVVGQLGLPPLAEVLSPLLERPERELRMWAGLSMAWLGDERGLGAARAALVGNRPWVRYYAVVALWRLGGERALAALEGGAHDPDPLVGEVARLALAGELQPWHQPPPEDPTLTGGDLTSLIEEAAGLLVEESDSWFHLGDYRQCVRAQEAALFLVPELGWLHGINGWLYWSMDRHTEALGAYMRWVQAAPGDWQAHLELGHHFFLTRDYVAAAESLGRARELGCPQVPAHMHAHALERAGRTTEALRAWRELAAADPADHIPPRHISRLEAMLDAR